jgi:hypothetical protein
LVKHNQKLTAIDWEIYFNVFSGIPLPSEAGRGWIATEARNKRFG